MADRIVIVDIWRGRERVSTAEILQMAGRCARQPNQIGHVDIIINEDDVQTLKDEMQDADHLRVDSVLYDAETLAFHLVSEISSGEIRTLSEAKRWYGKSFAAFTGFSCEVEQAVDLLSEEWETITRRGDFLFPTDLAHIASRFYFHPADIYYWRENFFELFESELQKNDPAIAWALSNVARERKRGNLYGCWELIEEYKDQVSSLGLDCSKTIAGGLVWWSLLGGPSTSKLSSQKKEAKEDFGRIYGALLKINECSGWDKRKFFEDLRVRIAYKIPDELVNLCKLEGIGKSVAFELYNLGVENAEGIRENWDAIETFGTDELIEKLRHLSYG